jgi:hypothetical protein
MQSMDIEHVQSSHSYKQGTCQIRMSTVLVSETQNADATFDNISITMIEIFFFNLVVVT